MNTSSATQNSGRAKIKSGHKINSSKNAKYIRLAIGLVIVGVIIGVALLGGGPKAKPKQVAAPQTACGPYRNDGVIQLGGTNLKVEVTKNSAEFEKGLGGRPCILANQGMLFPFAKPAVLPMWMKDMKFPIDIIWIDANHRAVALEIDVKPDTYPDKFENKAPAQYVLEIKANQSRKLGVTIGSPINF